MYLILIQILKKIIGATSSILGMLIIHITTTIEITIIKIKMYKMQKIDLTGSG